MRSAFSKLSSVVLIGLLFLPFQLAGADSRAIYAGTTNGVFKSTDGGSTWTEANSGLAGIDVFSLAIDPANPATLYAGTFGSGVFKTTDGGHSWALASSGLTDAIVLSLAIDPATPSTLYSGATSAFFAGSVFKSTNGGHDWTVSNSGLPVAIIDVLAIDPSNPAIIYAGTNYAGVFKSTDGGQSWTAASSGMTPALIDDIALDPANSATLYAGLGGCSFGCLLPAGVFKSTDGGSSWTAINAGLTDLQVVSLAVDPANTNILYAGTRLEGVFKSTNGGTDWSLANSAILGTLYATLHFPLVIDPLNTATIYAGTADGVFKSTDGGLNWTGVNTGLPASTSVFALAISPVNGPAIALSSTALSFANQPVGTTSSPQSITLRNVGSQPLVFRRIVSTRMFPQTNTCGASLAPGQRCTISVAFDPVAPGVKKGLLFLVDNDSLGPSPVQFVRTTGTGM